MSRHIHTIEDNFQYRMHHLLKEMHKDWIEQKKDYPNFVQTFEDYLWTNRQEFGAKCIEDIESYSGITECLDSPNI